MRGTLIKRGKKLLVEYISDLGNPGLLPLHPEDERRLQPVDDLSETEVEFKIVTYNIPGSYYNSFTYPPYAMLSTPILDKLKTHLNSISHEQFKQE